MKRSPGPLCRSQPPRCLLWWWIDFVCFRLHLLPKMAFFVLRTTAAYQDLLWGECAYTECIRNSTIVSKLSGRKVTFFFQGWIMKEIVGLLWVFHYWHDNQRGRKYHKYHGDYPMFNFKQHLPCLFPFRSKFTFGSQAILSGRQSDGRVIVGEPETKCS